MLELHASDMNPLEAPLDLLVIACSENQVAETPLVHAADARLGGTLRQAIDDERFKGKTGQSLVIHTFGRLPASRLALLGCGPAGDLGSREAHVAAGRAARLAAASGARSAGLAGLSLAAGPGAVQALAEGALLGLYRFDKYLTGDRRVPTTLAALTLFGPPEARVEDDGHAFRRASETARAVARARDLVNEPAGYLTPTRLAAQAEEWARESGLEVE